MRSTSPLLPSVPLVLLALPASAQTPFAPRPDLWVTDSSNDRIARLADLDFDGDYDGPLESAVFYDDTVGGYPLSSNACILAESDGSLLVGDTATDVILRLIDADGDGTAHDAGEAREYFTSVFNASGVEAQAVNGLTRSGAFVYAAVAQAGSSGRDFVMLLQDVNGDHDADDASEAREYFVRSDMSVPGTTAGDSIVQDVEVGLDGRVYYLENGSTGVYAKGVYRLVDLDQNGVIDPATEVFAFFIPPPQGGTAFFWALEQGRDGAWYLVDTGNDFAWRAFDASGDGSIGAGEASAWWTSPASSLSWDSHFGADGALYVSESQTNERVFRMRDDDGNGSIDPLTEVATLYDETLSSGAPIGQIRGFAIDARWQDPWTVYCAAQTNSLGCLGRISGADGWPSASHGSGFVIHAADLRNQKSGLLFYGVDGRSAVPFGGGTMCIAPPRRRTALASTGGSAFGDDCTGTFAFDFNARIASGLDPALVFGETVVAQFWSRDPGSFPSNTHLTDALEFQILR
jgi:hypothetical protein